MFGFEIYWWEVCEELLKLLGSLVVLLLAGWIAYTLHWIGQRRSDAQKYLYELFTSEQLRRIDLLHEMRGLAFDIDEWILVVHHAKVKLALHATGRVDLRLAQDSERRGSEHTTKIRCHHDELQRLARRYGQSPSFGDWESVMLHTITRDWIAGFDHATQGAGILEGNRLSDLQSYSLRYLSTLATLLTLEEHILLSTPYDKVPSAFRARPETSATPLLPRKRNVSRTRPSFWQTLKSKLGL